MSPCSIRLTTASTGLKSLTLLGTAAMGACCRIRGWLRSMSGWGVGLELGDEGRCTSVECFSPSYRRKKGSDNEHSKGQRSILFSVQSMNKPRPMWKDWIVTARPLKSSTVDKENLNAMWVKTPSSSWLERLKDAACVICGPTVTVNLLARRDVQPLAPIS